MIHPRNLWVRGSNLTGGHNRLSCPRSADTAMKPYLTLLSYCKPSGAQLKCGRFHLQPSQASPPNIWLHGCMGLVAHESCVMPVEAQIPREYNTDP